MSSRLNHCTNFTFHLFKLILKMHYLPNKTDFENFKIIVVIRFSYPFHNSKYCKWPIPPYETLTCSREKNHCTKHRISPSYEQKKQGVCNSTSRNVKCTGTSPITILKVETIVPLIVNMIQECLTWNFHAAVHVKITLIQVMMNLASQWETFGLEYQGIKSSCCY